MADIKIPKGDFGYALSFTIKKNDGTIFDLTDYTLKFKVWNPSTPDNLMVNGTVTSATPTSGVCIYTIVEHDFDIKGTYQAEIEMTKTGVKESTRAYTLEVTESG